ncbi:MAG: hypothetical protein ABSC94_13610 [Polyangiaceae bacterium]
MSDADTVNDAAAVTGGADLSPPPPVVAEDPSIPVHEAVVGATPVPADYAAPMPPPAPVVEEEPPQPEPDEAWIPGYWWWSPPLGRYVWVSGAWRRPPPDEIWSPGAWNLVDGAYAWAPGYWGPRGYAAVYVDVGPPPWRAEVYGAPPSVGFVWTPGYYGYRGGSYVWVGGSWLRPPGAGLGWIEPRYVSIGHRYAFQPGRWDFAPERRGTVYRPDVNAHPGAHLRLTPLPQGVVSAHANFVTAAARAIAHGATRTANGGYAMRGGAGTPHAIGHPGEDEAHGVVGPAREGEPHGAGSPPGGGEARPKDEFKKGTELRGGAAAKETPFHGPTPVEEHRGGPPPSRVAAPAGVHEGAPHPATKRRP